jgi:PAS domain S-box-containing protein
MRAQKLSEEIDALRHRLEEAEETIKAIRHGGVDAIVVEERGGHSVYTLDGADRPYRLLIEQTQQGAATLDAEGTITYCNVSLASLLDLPLERLIGAPLQDFVRVVDRPRYQALFREGQAGASNGEMELCRSGGEVIPSYIAFSALRGSAAVGVLVTDLTIQKRQAELAAANEVLRETNRLKDDFLMTLSHELRTPLNAILGWAHMLRDDTLSPETQRRALDAVARNAEAQAQLVEDLLDVSRIVSGKLQIKNEAVDLATVAEGAVETVLLAARAKRIALKVTLDPDTQILVQGDGERLQQVVWNLLSNAIKFTPSDGSIELQLRSNETTAEIVVRDNGQGIRADFLPYVFQRFRQADGTGGRNKGGLGLGLAIVRHITEAHGGTVSAESAGEGRGATFVVRLPVSAVNQRTRSVTDMDDGVTKAGLARARVLVVDDNADAREVMRLVLECRGAEVTTVASTEEALRTLKQRSFNVLLCDIGMPGQDGYALIRAIRDLPAGEGGDVPAVAVTAYAGSRERDAALNAGYNWYLAKPFELDQVISLVSNAATLKSGSPAVGPDHL